MIDRDKLKEQLLQVRSRMEEMEKKLAELEAVQARLQKAENDLRQAQAVIGTLLNATSDLALLMNRDGTILEINESAARMLGKSRTELVGRSLYDFFLPAAREFRKAHLNVVIHSGQQVRFEDEFRGALFQTCIYPVPASQGEFELFAVFFNDVTERRRSEEMLFRYTQILSTVHDPMSFVDSHYIFRTVNDAFLSVYRKRRHEVIEYTVEEVLGKEVFAKQIKPYLDRCLAGETAHAHEWFDFPDGQRRCMYMIYYPLFAKDQVVLGAVVNAIDVTRMKELEEQLKELSVTDQLTQIHNRVRFNESLEEEVRISRRYKTDLSLIMFDIDHFKRVNDTHGHDIGDKVLVTIVELVRHSLRETDIFARWGGEEFMILLPHTKQEKAAILAERIRHTIESAAFEIVQCVTCSFGVTQFHEDDTTETFVKRVDAQMYNAKASGRNQVAATF